MSEPTLADVMARLEAIEQRLETIPDAIEIGSMIATTAEREQVAEIQKTLDALWKRLDDVDRQSALADIRQSLRRVV